MRFHHWILSLTLALLALGGPALAQGGRGGGQGRGGQGRGDMINPERIDRLADKLNLSDALRVEIKAIATKAKSQSIDLRAAQDKARLKMRTLMDQPEPPRAAIMAQIDAMGVLRVKQRKLKTGALLDIRAKLTPEQRVQLKKMRRNFRKGSRNKMRKGRRGQRGQRGQRGMGRGQGRRGKGMGPGGNMNGPPAGPGSVAP